MWTLKLKHLKKDCAFHKLIDGIKHKHLTDISSCNIFMKIN